MPKYFFHLHDDIDAPDEDGCELPDLDAATFEAVRGARALVCEQVLKGRLNLSHRIDVEDEAGQVLATISFSDAVTVES